MRQATPITDEALRSLCAELQTRFGCRAVGLRESAQLTGAATVGWLHPVVLLGPDWRAWSRTERCAVLAHELAHVLFHFEKDKDETGIVSLFSRRSDPDD